MICVQEELYRRYSNTLGEDYYQCVDIVDDLASRLCREEEDQRHLNNLNNIRDQIKEIDPTDPELEPKIQALLQEVRPYEDLKIILTALAGYDKHAEIVQNLLDYKNFRDSLVRPVRPLTETSRKRIQAIAQVSRLSETHPDKTHSDN